MSIEKMSLVNIVGSLSELDDTLIRCCESGYLHQESSIDSIDGSSGFIVLNDSNPFSGTLRKLTDISMEVSIDLKFSDFSSLDMDFPHIQKFVEEVGNELSDINIKRNTLKEEISQLKLSAIQIQHLANLNASFDDILSLKHTKVQFGRLPVTSYRKFEYYYGSKPFMFLPLDTDEDFEWGLYFSPPQKAQEIADIFASLLFEPIRVPDFVHGTPSESLQYIADLLVKRNQELVELEARFNEIKSSRFDEINVIFSKIKFSYDIFEFRKNAAILNNKFYLVGFVPHQHIDEFEKLFDDTQSVVCVDHPPDSDPQIAPPVKLKNNLFSQPFEGFVEMYGLPSYKGFDPTFLVSATYTLLFGIMFGDLGQGLVISLVGFLIWKLKNIPLGRILTRVGFSSAFFGTVYGSVFGFEHVLDPFYKAVFGLDSKPIEVFHSETTNLLLLGAVGFGAVLIILSITINVILGFKAKDTERAIFGVNGLAGLVFYVSAIAAAVCMILLNINVLNPVFIGVFIVLPLLVMFFREPLTKLSKRSKDIKPKEGIGGFIIENFFELFEFVLSYLTNTMSFLRVGGFVLSHAGMMAVVMTLSEMIGGVGSPIVVVIGNIFVLGMEGLIVGIQVLRLEFYEIFSRFYDGDGKPFTPAKVSYEINKK
ncbi:MAG: Archaeal/vacuolar-type H+-ATPase subunit [Oscillospiraceae bacterium]|jgi:V/A-type H+-transporting ATPase subunit I|nr:Archaeal/vacuolar-type H+-ATPase subunit [Oscillospiraceae bacterium]